MIISTQPTPPHAIPIIAPNGNAPAGVESAPTTCIPPRVVDVTVAVDCVSDVSAIIIDVGDGLVVLAVLRAVCALLDLTWIAVVDVVDEPSGDVVIAAMSMAVVALVTVVVAMI